MALDFLNESPSDAAEASAMKAETSTPNPEPPKTPEPAPAPAAAAPDPAPAPPAEPPKAAEAAPPVKKDGAPVGFVPNAALKEARERARLLEQELADLRAGKQPAAEPAKEIDPETDPIAALKEVREFQKTQREREQQANQIREFSNRVQAHEADWAAANPEYGEQIKFLHDFRAAQLEALGFSRDQIGMQLQQEALQTADLAFRNGKNPGEVFSTLAIKSGWKAKETPAPATPAAPAAPPADVEAKRQESEAALERISRGQKASRATAGGGGNEPAEDMTVERLASLNGAAFDAAMEKHGKRLFGG